jgi:hypothetical protein
MRWFVVPVLAVTLGGCSTSPPPDPEEPRVNPDTVPSLALLSEDSAAGPAGKLSEVVGHGGGTSCQDAIADAKARARGGSSVEEPPFDHESAIKDILNHGAYVADCGVSETVGVDVCVVIESGRAVGASVTLNPGEHGQADCVADAIRSMDFPEHELPAVARTRFDPE